MQRNYKITAPTTTRFFVTVLTPAADCLPRSPCNAHSKLFLPFWSEDRSNAPHVNPFPVTALDNQRHDSNGSF